MPASLTLSVLETGAKEIMVMRSLLNLAGSGEGQPGWQVVTEPGGEVTIVDVDTEAGRRQWEEITEVGQSPIALTRSRDFEAEFRLSKPLRSRQFLDLLERLRQRQTEVPDSVTEEPEAQVTPVWQAWEQREDPDIATLAEHLRRKTWSAAVELNHAGWPRLLIDPGSGSWYYDGSISDMTPAMFSEVLPATAGIPVSSDELARRAGTMERRSLSELKWFAGLAQSRGRLHPDLVDEVEFMLTQVPPQALDNEHFQRLAKILIRQPVTLDELHEDSGEAPTTVVSFLNACYTAGRLLLNQPARAAVNF